MTNTIAFLSILIIFMRLYSIFGITFLTEGKAKFAERITTTQYHFFMLKNISVVWIIYIISDITLLLTFNFTSDTAKSFNRIFLTYTFLINALLGIITLLF